MKKIAMFLSVIMLFSMMAFSVNADDEAGQANADKAKITVDGTEYTFDVGEKITYTVNLQNDTVINNGQFNVFYPNDIISVISYSIPKIDPHSTAHNDKAAKGIFVFNFSDIDKGGDFRETAALISINFSVDAAGEGAISFLCETIASVDSDYVMKAEENVVFSETLDKYIAPDESESASSEAAASESTTSESASSESATSESASSESAASETAASESASSESASSETAASESASSEGASSETGASESSSSEGASSEAVASESTSSESATSEAAASESSSSESASSEASASESSTSESATSEAGASESASSESASSEASASESSTSESATSEASSSEIASSESASSEAGTSESAPDEMIDISSWKVTNLKNKPYTGKAITQEIFVEKGNEIAAVEVTYKNNIKIGKATIIIKGIGCYQGKIVKYFKIVKAKNPMTVTASAKTVKYSKLKNKSLTVKALTIKKNKGKLSYRKASGSKNITISSKGKLTVKKGTAKGTYTARIKVTAKGNSNYKLLTKTVTVKITVK